MGPVKESIYFGLIVAVVLLAVIVLLADDVTTEGVTFYVNR